MAAPILFSFYDFVVWLHVMVIYIYMQVYIYICIKYVRLRWYRYTEIYMASTGEVLREKHLYRRPFS